MFSSRPRWCTTTTLISLHPEKRGDAWRLVLFEFAFWLNFHSQKLLWSCCFNLNCNIEGWRFRLICPRKRIFCNLLLFNSFPISPPSIFLLGIQITDSRLKFNRNASNCFYLFILRMTHTLPMLARSGLCSPKSDLKWKKSRLVNELGPISFLLEHVTMRIIHGGRPSLRQKNAFTNVIEGFKV